MHSRWTPDISGGLHMNSTWTPDVSGGLHMDSTWNQYELQTTLDSRWSLDGVHIGASGVPDDPQNELHIFHIDSMWTPEIVGFHGSDSR